MMSSRGQATVEFLLVFLAAVVFFTVLVAALGVAGKRAKEQGDAAAATAGMEEFARTFEVYANDGIAMFFRTGASYRVENGVVKSDYGNRTIVVKGVFDGARGVAEPE